MRNPNPVAAVRSAVVSTLTNQYVRRLLLSMLFTGFDGSVLLTAGRYVYEAAPLEPWLAFAFAALAVGLLITLGRLWLLTLRTARISEHPNLSPEERRFQ